MLKQIAVSSHRHTYVKRKYMYIYVCSFVSVILTDGEAIDVK